MKTLIAAFVLATMTTTSFATGNDHEALSSIYLVYQEAQLCAGRFAMFTDSEISRIQAIAEERTAGFDAETSQRIWEEAGKLAARLQTSSDMIAHNSCSSLRSTIRVLTVPAYDPGKNPFN